MARPRKLRPTSTKIFQGADGAWHGYATVGVKPDGRPDVRHRSAKTEAECAAKIRKLEDQRAAGRIAKPGQVPTLAEWMQTWLSEVVAGLRYATGQRSYGWASRIHIVPGLGYHRLDALVDDSSPIDRFYRQLEKTVGQRSGKPLSAASVHAVHRTLRAALNEAVRRKLIPVNPLATVRAPKSGDAEEITPLFVDEVRRILAVCQGRRNGTRWSVGMPLGLRQGEALGLPWMKPSTSTRDKPTGMDLADGFVNTRIKAERKKWLHGCDDPPSCAREHCRTRPCQPPWRHGCAEPASCYVQAWRCRQRVPGRCRTHRRACPQPCPPGCTEHARCCPQRTGGGIVMGETKSVAGKRRAALSPPELRAMRAHKAAQDGERELAGELWDEHDLVWCTPLGRPIDASADRADWKSVLREAKVRDARVHDGRHTAATMLLLQGVDERVVMEIMGWSDRRMLKLYQHVLDELRVEAARRIGTLLWGEEPGPVPTPPTSAASRLEIPTGSTTDLATGNVIPFRPRAPQRPSAAGQAT
jgi:integrase